MLQYFLVFIKRLCLCSLMSCWVYYKSHVFFVWIAFIFKVKSQAYCMSLAIQLYVQLDFLLDHLKWCVARVTFIHFDEPSNSLWTSFKFFLLFLTIQCELKHYSFVRRDTSCFLNTIELCSCSLMNNLTFISYLDFFNLLQYVQFRL